MSQFEIHNENIYTGVCGVALDINQMYSMAETKVPILTLKTNISFTTDLTIAKQFRGSTGMIIGINMNTNYNVTPLGQMSMLGYHHSVCDVSFFFSKQYHGFQTVHGKKKF